MSSTTTCICITTCQARVTSRRDIAAGLQLLSRESYQQHNLGTGAHVVKVFSRG